MSPSNMVWLFFLVYQHLVTTNECQTFKKTLKCSAHCSIKVQTLPKPGILGTRKKKTYFCPENRTTPLTMSSPAQSIPAALEQHCTALRTPHTQSVSLAQLSREAFLMHIPQGALPSGKRGRRTVTKQLLQAQGDPPEITAVSKELEP